jgi:predicted ATPase
VKLVAFRITNFRSIRDTGWRDLSTDNITGLIGQNESGKSSVLESLYSFYTGELDEDYLRSDGIYPDVSCSFEVTGDELKDIFVNFQLPKDLLATVEKNRSRVNFTRRWTGITEKESTIELEQESLKSVWPVVEDEAVEEQPVLTPVPAAAVAATTPAPEPTPDPEPAVPEVLTPATLQSDEFLDGLVMEMPVFELFEDNGSLLPPTIDLADITKKTAKTKGIKGALNFLSIIGVTTDDLSGPNMRIVKSKIRNANKQLTTEFQTFWSQYIGKNNKIEIEFELNHHDATVAAKAGQPYLTFWVKDGGELLHPAQRSKGVQWFLSFFLQLKASALLSEKGQVLLIDEPGANLHAKAQEDVLKVFEDIKKHLQVIYTTHSPYLIEAKTLYRLLAVQRSKEDDDNSETQVFGAHELEAASEDTLLPVYTLIGVGMQHQRVIKAKNNVILEEPSAFYYLKAFRQLTGETTEMNFLPATGVTKIPLLVNLFLGWGLDFIIVVDDDEAGKKTLRKIKADVYGGDSAKSKKHLVAIKDCKGVEDMFTKGDFKEHVLGDKKLTYTDDNSAYMNQNRDSKVITAVKFAQSVEDGAITFEGLAKTTQANIQSLLKQIKDRL